MTPGPPSRCGTWWHTAPTVRARPPAMPESSCRSSRFWHRKLRWLPPSLPWMPSYRLLDTIRAIRLSLLQLQMARHHRLRRKEQQLPYTEHHHLLLAHTIIVRLPLQRERRCSSSRRPRRCRRCRALSSGLDFTASKKKTSE